MKIIGFTGAAGAGKDTACQELKAVTPLEVRRFAFADALKESAARSLGAFASNTQGHVDFCNKLKQPDVQIHITQFVPANIGPDPEPPEYIPLTEISGREFLQFFGTEGHREVFGQEFWVEQLRARIDQRCQGFEGIVAITDCRFPNEAEAIHRWGGEVWAIKRSIVDDSGDTHASEAGLALELIDRVIHNEGDLADLRHMVGETLELSS